ncbi:MAG: peptidoglycan DD-metalloendopeptidase family protein [Clostridia bacterium]|nr:peptidoglycan DD-metalloendopeptidase family protein [Clostridia bacterium]
MKNKILNTSRSKRFAALVLASVIAFFTVATVSGYDFGYKLYVGGEYVASFATEEEAEALPGKIMEEDGIDISEETDITFGLMDSESFTTVELACETFRKQDDRYAYAYTLYFGEERVFSLYTLDEVVNVKHEYIARFEEEGTESISYTKPITIDQGYILKDWISDKDGAFGLMEEKASVESVVKLSFYEAIPYETITIEDPEMYVGETAVDAEGVTGEKYIEHTYNKLNGETVNEYVSGEYMVTEVENRVVRKGTKAYPKGKANGNFINPTKGVLTSPFGPRWGRMHNGIDVGAPNGTPMYAADGGTVIYSGWMSGYGYLVQIDHKNGFTTYYAHCSALHVKVGDKVNQGDLIADMGSTGNSTGPHLHFEVRLNNVPQNPLNYVNY